ncbi:restriction endonuclease subunit S [Enterococcus faecium]|nr:restriction endonuclease subunit S [Enterococcus faecium]EME3488882.1 restriction endonuclease subunit S [Enterococcus faecium]
MSNNAQPEIRFPGFTEGWEQHKLIEVARYRNGKAHEQAIDESGKYIVVNSKFVSTNGRVKKYTNIIIDPLKKNELAFVLSDVPNGKAIARTFLVDKEHRYSLNQRIAGITPHKDTDSYFLNVLMNRNPYFLKFDNGVGQTNLTKADVENFIGHYPSYEEQQKIGTFFKQLDDTIALHQRKLDLLKETKKGFLQKMFPKNGAKVPEIRFPGFTEDWEERKLNEGMTEYTDRVYIQDDEIYKQVSVKNVGEITLRGEQIGSKIGRKRQAKVNLIEHPDTLIFTRQTIEQGGIGFAPKETDGAIVTENMPTIDVDNDIINCNYLLAYVKTEDWYRKVILKNIEGGTAQIAIHEDSILFSEVLIPKIEEQQKIGAFFKQLDDTITLHQRKLDLLKETKKGFLQKMFV